MLKLLHVKFSHDDRLTKPEVAAAFIEPGATDDEIAGLGAQISQAFPDRTIRVYEQQPEWKRRYEAL